MVVEINRFKYFKQSELLIIKVALKALKKIVYFEHKNKVQELIEEIEKI